MNPRQRGTDSPTRIRSRAVVFLSLLLVVPAIAGCVGVPKDFTSSSDNDSATSPDRRDGSGGDGSTPRGGGNASSATWPTVLNLTPTFAEAYGSPFNYVDYRGPTCDTYPRFIVPANATSLKLVLWGDPGSPTADDDAGYMTMRANAPGPTPRFSPDHENGTVYPNGSLAGVHGYQAAGVHTYQIENRVEIYVDDPKPGKWRVWVWPNRRVVGQTWNLTVHVDGDGPGADAVRLVPIGGDNPGGYKYCDRTAERYLS